MDCEPHRLLFCAHQSIALNKCRTSISQSNGRFEQTNKLSLYRKTFNERNGHSRGNEKTVKPARTSIELMKTPLLFIFECLTKFNIKLIKKKSNLNIIISNHPPQYTIHVCIPKWPYPLEKKYKRNEIERQNRNP